MPASVDASAPLALTFILPTRNRRALVGRAIESCLRVERPSVKVEVLIIDGNSTDGSFEELQQRYGKDARVRLVRQTGPKGFMPACFLSVPMVQTPFVTFMYDDDVLSPFWGDMPVEMKRRGLDFVMGFAADGTEEKVFPFERVTKLRIVDRSFLSHAYFGCGHQLCNLALPFSPICCLTTTERLRDWVGELERFTRGRAFREYFMMERNAGPDLMIYFLSIDGQTGDIALFDGAVAQFTAHSASMSINFEPTDLPIGYWLAQVWLCDRLRRAGRTADAGWCAAYAVKQGLRLLLKRVRRGRWQWFGSFLREIVSLKLRTLCSGSGPAFVKSYFVLFLPRNSRPRFDQRMRVETLSGS